MESQSSLLRGFPGWPCIIHPGDFAYADDWYLKFSNLFEGKEAYESIIEQCFGPWGRGCSSMESQSSLLRGFPGWPCKACGLRLTQETSLTPMIGISNSQTCLRAKKPTSPLSNSSTTNSHQSQAASFTWPARETTKQTALRFHTWCELVVELFDNGLVGFFALKQV
jgi:hypothetical protein